MKEYSEYSRRIIIFDDLFGGMLDFDGNCETDFGEEMLGMAMLDDLSHEEENEVDIDSEKAELCEEIRFAIVELEDTLLDLEDQEPEDLYSELHEQWVERVDELEEKISEMEDQLEELESEE